MFEQLQIRIKRGSRVSAPDDSWTGLDRLYCAGLLQTGFGEVYAWEETNLLSLRKLIAFYHDLGESVRTAAPASFQHSFAHQGSNSIQLHWTVQPQARLNFTVYYRTPTREWELLSKALELPAVQHWRETTYAKLLAQVTEAVPTAISQKVGELFDDTPDAGYRFSPGQKVRTVVSQSIRTLRIGFVLHRFRRGTINTNSYQLLVDGKPVKKLYQETELEAMD